MSNKARNFAAGTIRIHGWNAAERFWHGPTEIAARPQRKTGAWRRLKNTSGPAFHAQFNCGLREFGSLDFLADIYDLGDAGVALLRMEGSGDGFAGALALIPADRRPRLRDDFAFGLLAFLGFLGNLVDPESELAIHDYVERELQAATGSGALAFSLEAAHNDSDAGILLSAFTEQLSAAMLEWLLARDGDADDLQPESETRTPALDAPTYAAL